MAHLIRSPRLESEGFNFSSFEPDYSHLYPSKTHRRWTGFPRRFQIRYLHEKVARHPRDQCIFSTYVRQMVDMPHAPRTKEEEWTLIDKLIEAWMCGRVNCVRDFLDPARCRDCLAREQRRFSSLEEWRKEFDRLLPISLASSAVAREDKEELEIILRQCKSLPYFRHGAVGVSMAYGFGAICPLLVAARCASGDIVRMLVSDAGGFQAKLTPRHTPELMVLTVHSGNRGAMKAFVQALRESSPDNTWCLHGAIRESIRGGRFDMLELIEPGYGPDFSEFREKAWFRVLHDAITRSCPETVRGLLGQWGFDANMKTEQYPCGALFRALYHTNLSLPIIESLLADGADPNEAHPKTKLLPLHYAVKIGNVELAKLLVDYGADVRLASHIPTTKGMYPLLLSAAQSRCAPLVEFVLQHGVETSFCWEGKRWELRESAAPVADNERVCYRFEISWKGNVAEHALVVQFYKRLKTISLRLR